MGRSDGPFVMPPSRFLGIAAVIVVLDQVTKWLAVAYLAPEYLPHPVLGEWLRLTLVYNPGAAFGLYLGGYSRWIFLALTVAALVVMWRLYRATEPGAPWRSWALVLVSGGAFGNLIDRLRSDRGVVDFIDIGTSTWRWPTFNVADMAVSSGAVILMIVLWQEDVARAKRQAAAG